MDKITAYQAKYLANYLTRRLPANDLNKLTASLQDAQVDLTPHQVEAAAEGISLQFCSLIVNYDMPWNPQRSEQRMTTICWFRLMSSRRR
ncbi:MAG: helicase-related protein [Bacteroidales bacterium]|nr:helicase-related protein [Bacteroidales bacterium]